MIYLWYIPYTLGLIGVVLLMFSMFWTKERNVDTTDLLFLIGILIIISIIAVKW